MKKLILIFIVFLAAGWQTFSQCDPRLKMKVPDNPDHFIKSFEAFMPNENDTVLKYTLLLHSGVDYKIEIFEAPEYMNKASYSLYEGNKLLAINHQKQSDKFFASFNFKSQKSMTYDIVVRKLVKGKYCASWVIQELKDSGEKYFELSQPEKTISDQDKPFIIVEDMPEFIAGKGAESFKEWIKDNIKYPEEALKKGIQGKLYVNFIVEKDGSVSNVKIVRGVDPILDKAALDLVRSAPKWEKVGKQRGVAVRVAFTFPIAYALSSK